jgi:hypothetical protein
MLSGVPMIMLLAAQASQPEAVSPPTAAAGMSAANYGPVPPPRPRDAIKAPDSCKTPEAKDVKEDTREIVVCAQKPEGYRIDPDVLAAQRAKKKGDAGKLRTPEKYVDNSCASVGPMGCRGVPAIDLLSAGAVLATMAQKAAKGEDVGKIFVTDPQSSEYQLYVEAKRQREAREAEQAAEAYAKDAAKANNQQPR